MSPCFLFPSTTLVSKYLRALKLPAVNNCGLSFFPKAGSAELTTWGGFITLTTSPERRLGRDQRWSLSGITSSGSSSVASSREPCSSSTRGSSMGWGIYGGLRVRVVWGFGHARGWPFPTKAAESVTVYDNISLCVAWQGGLIVMLVHLLAISTWGFVVTSI